MYITNNLNMKQKLLTCTALLSISLFIFSCGGGDTADLKLNVAKGDVYACKVKMDMKITTSAMGMNMNIDQLMEIDQTLSVDDVASSGNVTFTNVMERFYMKQSMPMMGMPINIEFDTDKPDKGGAMGESMAKYFSKMKGLTYQMEMDSQGKLLSSNMEEVYKKLGLDSLSQQGGGGNNSGNTADQYMSQLPDKPVKKGDSYTVETTASDMSPLAMKNTYTVKDITADVVTLEVKSEFLPGGEVSGIKMDIKGDQTGVVEIDRKTGMTIKSEIKQNLDMTVTSDGMKIPMKSNGNITFTCTKK